MARSSSMRFASSSSCLVIPEVLGGVLQVPSRVPGDDVQPVEREGRVRENDHAEVHLGAGKGGEVIGSCSQQWGLCG
jgi:hypothetical protein